MMGVVPVDGVEDLTWECESASFIAMLTPDVSGVLRGRA